VPVQDWVLALVGPSVPPTCFSSIANWQRVPASPTDMDLAVAVVGMVLLLEATRRALGLPMVIVALVFLVYTFARPYMPDMIAHRGASLSKGMSHQWLTTEGVFGVALGVSSGFIFLFVLFGSLLDKAGAGNYFIKSALCLAGPHARRPGQGGGGVLGGDRHHFRLVDRQRGHHRHLHHSADEARGLPADQAGAVEVQARSTARSCRR
jgi:TRAP-type uncharacterized transport system fused permease subunit